MGIVETITAVIITSIVSCLVTFFVTTLINNKTTAIIMKKHSEDHERFFHPETISHVIEQHVDKCAAPKDIKKIKESLIFVVTKLNGNPYELKLME